MSMSAVYHAERWAWGRSPAEIKARIVEIDAYLATPFTGTSLEDYRGRHQSQTELKTLQTILATGITITV